ncbi:DUF1843 domain-containing protein [Pseudomonas asiatica]|uniref:DUF1843 domain-containing protein n=1 Tax=Pseudomonas asiatica TaxID=2219225 RepID=UPI00345CC4CB
MSLNTPRPVPPYGVAIQQAIATGNLKAMKELVVRVDELLVQQGDLRTMLELLRVEIYRIESSAQFIDKDN